MDQAGEDVGSRGSGNTSRQHTIPVLLPGQRFGVGDERQVERPGTAELRVGIGQAAGWSPVDHDLIGLPGITTGEVETLPYYGGALFVRFRIDSAYRVTSAGSPRRSRTRPCAHRTWCSATLTVRSSAVVTIGGSGTWRLGTVRAVS